MNPVSVSLSSLEILNNKSAFVDISERGKSIGIGSYYRRVLINPRSNLGSRESCPFVIYSA